jgi:hypothetical protein
LTLYNNTTLLLAVTGDGSAKFAGPWACNNATPRAKATHIANPSGGGTTDAEARTAINAILVVLENNGQIATS